MTSLINGWSFHPYPAFPATLYPNTAFWNATNDAKNITYQIQLSWPFSWSSATPNTTAASNKTALTLYVLDGNAYGTTAAEAFKRRPPPAAPNPDGLVVSIGYPLTDAVYATTQRSIDFSPPLLPPPQTPPSGADDFLDFITTTLRRWVRKRQFPFVTFKRDALYGHSFGGLFVTYALISQPAEFDTYLIASPSLWWNRGIILDEVTKRLGSLADANGTSTGGRKPAVVISYGDLEQFPTRRRKETEAEFQARKGRILTRFNNTMVVQCHDLFDRIEGSGKAREVVLKEYEGSEHSSVAASAIVDGLEYFVDW
ncbi:Alpha/Beta hydrolase protein [Podospora aff. communis PSN243]|uniref:Alpha/Beta hydrolase protein n=1 Tax=Podospora aff. communis PSN243 TaxID=3040156 RepID=A0AAV9G4Q3_9PEZI|nr:Alpha/Beta hydrolase protein [Podospora aff. communis PSN243]